MATPVVVESNDRRLVYRPWAVGGALFMLVAGIAVLLGSLFWAQANGRTLLQVSVALMVGGFLTLYGIFYTFKNSETLIFDVPTRRILKKLPLIPEREVSRFDEIYSISQVGEMRTFCYVLTRKSQHGGGEIPISDDYLSNSRKPERVAFEDNILPVISAMLNLNPD